jgi:hypothetical protein
MRQMQKWATMVVMTLTMVGSGFADTPDATAFAPQATSPEAILGFENLAGWQLALSSNTAQVKLTPTRTQGNSAFSVTNPGNSLKLTSLPISSTSSALVGLGAPGATLSVDLRFLVGRSLSSGTIRLSVTSPSRGLNKAPLGKVDFQTIRPGTFQTVSFPITDQARSALAGAKFNDLTFELALTQLDPGEYLLDNLRIRPMQGVTADATTKPPVGYGGSVDFDIDFNNPSPLSATDNPDVPSPSPLEKTFEVGPIQIPAQFHLKSGQTSAGTSVQLDVGYSPTSLVTTCLYLADAKDTSLKNYIFASCTGGSQPGDIISASWARLGIVNGAAPMRLRAQLARRPLGDQVGSNLIPPMPTFWGSEDTCIVAPVSGQVVSPSQSCTDTLAETSKIMTDYFKAARTSNPSIGWIVPPVPEWAKRHGDGTPEPEDLTIAPLTFRSSALAGPSNVFSINKSGHMDEGGLFDAFWTLTGGVNYSSFPNTDRATTHLDADFGTHAVVFGIPVRVMGVSASADTDTGETTPNHLDPVSSLHANLNVLGLDYPGVNVSTSGQFDKTIPLFNSPNYDLIPIRIWIFKISAGVKAQSGLTIGGGVSTRGLDLSLTPQGSIEGYLFGGVDVFVASGGVQANVDLIKIKAPVVAGVTWFIDPSPTSCSGTIQGTLDSDFTLSSGGGEVDLVASFGLCPFCDDESMTIFNWPPVFQTSFPVLHENLNFASFELPTSLCTGNAVTASIQPLATVYGAIDYSLSGLAFSNNTSNGFGTPISCSNFTWSANTPGDSIIGVGCDAKVRFANTPHQSQIGLSVSHSVTDSFGRTLTETGSATPLNVSVATLAPGVHIATVQNADTKKTVPVTPVLQLETSGPTPGGYILSGTLVPQAGVDTTNIKYKWTVSHLGVTTDITCSLANLDACVPGGDLQFSLLQVYWVPVNDGSAEPYVVTLSAISKATGAVVGSDSFNAYFRTVVN